MSSFSVGDKVRVSTWYDPDETGVITHVGLGIDPSYRVEFEDGEYTFAPADKMMRQPAAPPPNATADVGAIQRNRARVQSLLFIWRGDAVMLADGATVEETRALAWMPHDIDTLLAALAQAEAQRDKAVAALKRIEEMAIAAMGEWMSSVELIPASLPELQVYWDIAKAAADALAQQEGGDGE